RRDEGRQNLARIAARQLPKHPRSPPRRLRPRHRRAGLAAVTTPRPDYYPQMASRMPDSQRELLRQLLQSAFEQTLDERIERYLSLNHQPLIADHHFSHASTEA